MGNDLSRGIVCGAAATISALLSDHGVAIEERAIRPAQLALAYDRASAEANDEPFPAFASGCAVKVEEHGTSRLYDMRLCERPWGTVLVDDPGPHAYSITLFRTHIGANRAGLGLPAADFTGHIDVMEGADGAVKISVRKLYGADGVDLAAPNSIDELVAAMAPFEDALDLRAELSAVATDDGHFDVTGEVHEAIHGLLDEPDGGAAGSWTRTTVAEEFHVDTACVDGCGLGKLTGSVVDSNGRTDSTFTFERTPIVGTCSACSSITVTDATGQDICPPKVSAGCAP